MRYLIAILLALLPLTASAQFGGVLNPPPELRLIDDARLEWRDASNADTLYFASYEPPRTFSAMVPRPADGVVVLDAPQGWAPGEMLYACRLWGEPPDTLWWFHCWPMAPGRVFLPLLHS